MSEENENTNENWLPEDLKELPSLQKFKDPGSMAKSYVEMQTLLGSKTSYPGEGATDEDWDNFYKPLVPEAYDLKFDDLKSVGSQEIINEGFVDNAKKLGLTNRQAQGLLDVFRSTLESKENEVLGAKEALSKEQQESLDKRFGKEIDVVKEEVDDYIKRAYGKEVLEFFQDNLYGNADALDALFKKAKATAQDSGLPSNSSGANSDAKDQLEAEFAAFLNNTHSKFKGALRDHRDSSHESAKNRFAEVQRLLSIYN